MNKRIKGFSLVEVMVGIGLLAIMSVTVTSLLFSTLRSAKKAASIAAVKNEGTYVLNSMANMIRYANSVTACSANSVTISRTDGTNIAYTYNAGTGTLASNGADLNSDNVQISVCSGINVFTCSANLSSVGICFNAENKVGGVVATDITEKAGSSGILFQSQVVLRNYGN